MDLNGMVCKRQCNTPFERIHEFAEIKVIVCVRHKQFPFGKVFCTGVEQVRVNALAVQLFWSAEPLDLAHLNTCGVEWGAPRNGDRAPSCSRPIRRSQ